MISILFLSLTILFLAGTFFLTAVNSSLRRMHKKEAEEQLQALGGRFFYRSFHLYFFPKQEYEGLYFSTICALNITRFLYAASVLVFVSQWIPLEATALSNVSLFWPWFWVFASVVIFLLIAFAIGDYLPRILGTRFPETTLKVCAPVASIFLFLVFPVTYLFLKFSQLFSPFTSLSPSEPMGTEELMDMLESPEMQKTFDDHDRKLFSSVVTFKERIAREVMVPRVNVFSLPAEMSILEASKLLAKEGYSRIPIYHNTVDNIVGVLMYKDVLSKYMEYVERGNDPKVLAAPIESIQKNVLHTPETKKISNLLQEFRKKQVHLAIVVDEYGGTEGIVTIEDILEEIVGEIADEYDQEQELFYAQPDGSWVVDARMNILDVEEELGIEIPEEGEYDTVGGYIYHTTGMIPAKGFVIHQDKFDMEILKSNDRSVEKVRLKAV